ncbi:MAG: nucleotidyltransferase domain-containing protein [Acidobacteria bacterium]|nr:nucleotidyltransferase domain-containing protein [Acidobacteriota bacterium]
MKESYRGRHVRVFRLERADVLAQLRTSAERLLRERRDVVAVWLFGSLARDRAAPGSDADLLIVVRDGAAPFLQRSESLARYFEDVGVGCDVLVYTESEVERLTAGGPSLVRTALREGVRLGGR